MQKINLHYRCPFMKIDSNAAKLLTLGIFRNRVSIMKVTVILVGPFRIGRFNETTREYPSATAVRNLIEELRIPVTLLGAVLINGIHAGVDEHLKDGDTVTLLPFIDGG